MRLLHGGFWNVMFWMWIFMVCMVKRLAKKMSEVGQSLVRCAEAGQFAFLSRCLYLSLSVGIVKKMELKGGEEFLEKVGLFCYLDDIFSLCVGVWMEEWVDSRKNSVS